MADDAIIDDLKWRGLLFQSSDEARIRERLRGEPARVYCGFDPTAPSLQVGNLVPLFGAGPVPARRPRARSRCSAAAPG